MVSPSNHRTTYAEVLLANDLSSTHESRPPFGVKCHQLGNGQAVTSSGQADRLFVGRHQEMAELNAALDDAMAGRGRLIMLAGEPGIGKTSIARE